MINASLPSLLSAFHIEAIESYDLVFAPTNIALPPATTSAVAMTTQSMLPLPALPYPPLPVAGGRTTTPALPAGGGGGGGGGTGVLVAIGVPVASFVGGIVGVCVLIFVGVQVAIGVFVGSAWKALMLPLPPLIASITGVAVASQAGVAVAC